MTIFNRWLARLAYSFLIFAGLLGYGIYQRVTAIGWSAESVAMAVGAIVAMLIGMYGLRVRHTALFKDSQTGVR